MLKTASARTTPRTMRRKREGRVTPPIEQVGYHTSSTASGECFCPSPPIDAAAAERRVRKLEAGEQRVGKRLPRRNRFPEPIRLHAVHRLGPSQPPHPAMRKAPIFEEYVSAPRRR